MGVTVPGGSRTESISTHSSMIQTQRYEEFDLIVHRAEGPVSLEEVRGAVEESHQGKVMPLEIWDFTRATPDNIDIEALGGLLGELFSMTQAGTEEKSAFIVPGDDTRQLTLLFQRLAEFQEYPVAFRSFPDLPSAVHWLFGSSWQEPLDALHPFPGDADPG